LAKAFQPPHPDEVKTVNNKRIAGISMLLAGWALSLALLPGVSQAQSAAPGASVAVASSAPAVGASAAKADGADNPYGIRAVWEQGDLVARCTLLILVLMSMASWYVVFTKVVEQSKIEKQYQVVQDHFWAGGSVRKSADALALDNPFRFIAEKALEGAGKHEGLLGAVDFNTWVSNSIQRAMASVQNRLQDGLAVLATVGSTAPFVGLFGTVWGIYHALVSIGLSGQASIDKVAGPVGESLIMTAIGLAVAVPAVLGYNWLVRRNKAAMESVHAFGNDLHAVMLATAKP